MDSFFENSHREFIIGPDTPVEGGTYQHPPYCSIKVDLKEPRLQKWLKQNLGVPLMDAVPMILHDMPVDVLWKFHNDRQSLRTFSLGGFLKIDGLQLPGCSPDAQALMVALYLEQSLKQKELAGSVWEKLKFKKKTSQSRSFQIQFHPDDKHLSVVYHSQNHGIFRFDPTAGDKTFTPVS